MLSAGQSSLTYIKEEPLMSVEENKSFMRRIYETFSTGDLRTLDQFMATDVIDHNPNPSQAPGLQGVQDYFQAVRGAFNNFRITVEDQVAEGDKVVSRVVYSGKHTGEFFGIAPTGKEITATGMDMSRIENGKIVERWGNQDDLKLMQELGVIPRTNTQLDRAA